MRRVDDAKGLVEAIDAARREALNSFGNPTVFLEHYLQATRHIEVQVFGDTHGEAP
jgi:propionyl-CoA carboxylase alpha chain